MSEKINELDDFGLTDREKAVLALAAEGKLDKEIAVELNIGVATVRTYWDRLRTKLKAINRAHAVSLGQDLHSLQERLGQEMDAFVLRRLEDIAIFACTEDGRLLTWNRGVESLFGYKEHEWVGQHMAMFFVPEDKEDADKELEEADRMEASLHDRWHLRKDGSRFWGTNTVIRCDPPIGEAAYSKIVREKAHPSER